MGKPKQKGMNLPKRFALVFVFLISFCSGKSQQGEVSASTASQLEAIVEKKDAEPDDDSYLMDLEYFRNHHLNMNSATAEELLQLHIPDFLQIRNFLSYRQMLGPLLSIYELQAVPGWDIETIYKLLSYITVEKNESPYHSIKERWKGGNASLLFRASQVIEKSKGYEMQNKPDVSRYIGSAQKIFMRYSYNYKQSLSYGITGEKDAGEPFLRGAQRNGFDFYSFHFFLRQSGTIRSLAIGDFTVNLGQGLIQWQDFSFTKSSQSLAIKREAASLKPYRSAGEYNFHRGLGICLQKGKWQSTLFVSFRKISTNLFKDTISGDAEFSSFQSGGYHRTAAEIADRNNNSQLTTGGNIRYASGGLILGFNAVNIHFSRPIVKRDEPYNHYSLKGDHLMDYSIDYSYTLRNLHLFGEFASDHLSHRAIILGGMLSLGENLDFGFIYRNISIAFQSLYSDAFTENSTPNNEKGMYMAFAFRPVAGINVHMYYDLYLFPWLKYGVSGPSGGRDFLIQLSYQPTKFCQLTGLLRQESKGINGTILQNGTYPMINPVKNKVSIQSDFNVTGTLGFNSRLEWVKITGQGSLLQNGFLGMMGISLRRSHTSGNFGAAFFETDNYNTRIYSFEPDMMYNFSLPVFYGRGLHYYFNIYRDLSRLFSHTASRFHLSAWIKWEQSFYPGVSSIGSGLDEIPGDRKSQIKAQVLVQWQ
jgi:hypothetical protein